MTTVVRTPPRRTGRAGAVGTAAILTRAGAISSVGDGMFYVTSALALTELAGVGDGAVGFMLSGVWLLAWALTPAIGALGDRFGLGRTLVLSALVIGAALGVLSMARGVPVTLTALAGYAVGQSGVVALSQAVVAVSAAAQERTRLRATLQVIANAGIAAGAGLGGLALTSGSGSALRLVIAVDAVAFMAAALVLRPLWRALPVAATAAPVAGGAPAGVPARRPDRRFVMATALAAVVMLYMPMLSVALPLALAASALPTWTIAAVFIGNTIGVVALQRRAARDVSSLPAARRALRRAALALLLGCVAFGVALQADSSVAASLIVVAVLAQVIGEVLAAAGLWEVGFALAPVEAAGRWQATWSSSVPAARAVGPAVVAWLVVGHGLAGWAGLGLLLGGAALALARVARRTAAD